ncbi:MAG TPA: lysylphosphatidylglycerol synthase transmembrane domain-containing protein [Gaiellaceae bacterium]|nr:lysylphosphatidylglycerol synthase transmembrane domain-containing protein [Gaiellaceae bacterium]
MTRRAAPGDRRRGPLGVVLAHHREQEPHHVVMLMILAAALSLVASILVAGAAGYVSVASRIRHANTYWFPFAIAGAVAAHVGYTFAYREIAHVGRGVRLGTLRAGAIVAAGFGMFIPRGGFAVDIEALEDLGVPPDEARIRVLGLGSLEYAVLATGTLVCAIFLLLDHAHAQRAVTLSWTIGVPVGTGLALLAVRYRKWICRGFLQKILGPPLEAIGVVGQIVASPRRHGAAAFSGMAVYWAGEVFVLWVCLAAFDRDTPSVTAVVVGYATGYALTRRTLPLAGAGAVEALLPFALTWVGYGLPSAVLAVFAYRIFNLWLPLGPAAVALYHLQRRGPETAGPSPPDAEVGGDDRDGEPVEDARGVRDANG